MEEPAFTQDKAIIKRIRNKYRSLSELMDERMRRQWAASEADDLGWGGVTAVALATGLARNTIMGGARELESRRAHPRAEVSLRIREAGGGRKALSANDPGLLAALEALVDPVTRGHPESPLRWTCKSTGTLAAELKRQQHPVSDRTVAALLKAAGYSLQANRKTREGSSHEDRNAQFEHINQRVQAFQRREEPVVSIDTKKKELVGEFKNGGQEWQPQGQPTEVKVHDFPEPTMGKAIPYGVYDLASNEGWVSVGIDHDTAQFATASVRRWWQEMGAGRFPQATQLMITADGGGSNGSRNRLWKVALQTLADELGLRLEICHFPPGTSKWNKVEHRLFSFISSNWRGEPLSDYETIVNLISRTTTTKGLKVICRLDRRKYPTGRRVSDEEMKTVNVERSKFHGDWNYIIRPHETH